MSQTKSLDIVKEMQDLTMQVVERIRTGNNSLTDLEERLMRMINDPACKVNTDPAFILEMCKYFRSSVTGETKMIWDFAVNMRQRFPSRPAEPPKEIPGSEVIEQMSPTDRDAIRDQL